MKTKNDIQKKVQEAMDSLNGIQRAEPQPYFYTRLIAKLQRNERTIWETTGSFLARPVVAVAGLCFILVMNAVILLRQDKDTSATSIQVAIETPMTDNEYVVASSSSFDYENLDQ
jgi:type IV secretory pathway component VirB8